MEVSKKVRNGQRPRRICFVTGAHFEERLGGAERVIRDLASELRDRKWDVSFVVAGKSEGSGQTKSGDSIRYYREHRFLAVESFLSMYRALSEADASVYYQRVTSPLTLATALYCELNGRMMIWASAHKRDVQWFRHVRELRLPGKFGQFSLGGKIVASLNRALIDLAYPLGILLADIRIVETQNQQRLLRKWFGRSSVVLNKGYPRLAREDERSQFTDRSVSEPTAVWIANLRHWKRPEIFIQLADDLQDSRRRFLMIGAQNRNESVQANLEERIQRVEGLEYLGELPHSEVLQQLSAADVLISTSEEEGFPNVFIEAWMMNTPVVSLECDPGGIIECFRTGAVAHSYGELMQLCEDYLTSARTVEPGAFERVVDLFDMERHVSQLETIIESYWAEGCVVVE